MSLLFRFSQKLIGDLNQPGKFKGKGDKTALVVLCVTSMRQEGSEIQGIGYSVHDLKHAGRLLLKRRKGGDLPQKPRISKQLYSIDTPYPLGKVCRISCFWFNGIR